MMESESQAQAEGEALTADPAAPRRAPPGESGFCRLACWGRGGGGQALPALPAATSPRVISDLHGAHIVASLLSVAERDF